VRYLIVNADDFGLTAGINAGIVEAHSRGIVTSASLMVKQLQTAEAAHLALAHPQLGIGLHIDLCEWEPVNDAWEQIYARVDVGDPAQVRAEIEAQVELFINLMGRKPDHLDSHQHVHLAGVVRNESLRIAGRLEVPLRKLDSRIASCGEFYGQQQNAKAYPEGVTVASLISSVDAMADGWTELVCHPGYANNLKSIYAAEREVELAVLCSPEVQQALRARGVERRTFGDFDLDRFRS